MSRMPGKFYRRLTALEKSYGLLIHQQNEKMGLGKIGRAHV